MTISGSRASALARFAAMMTATWAGGVIAQQPAPESVPKELSVEIVVTEPGKKVPRVDAEGEPVPGAFTLQGRSLVWIVGKDRYSTPEEVRRAMLRHLQDAENRAEDEKTGEIIAPPVRLVPGPGVVWDDVIRLLHWAYGEGFLDVTLAGDWREPPIFVPLGVRDPVTDQGALVVPACMFNEPDDDPPGRWRAEIAVRQDGVITSDGERLFEPGKDKDLSKLRKAVLAWEPKAKQQDGLIPQEVSGSVHAIPRTHVLIRADKWVEWSRVQAVMQECAKGDLVFSRFYFAVADEEQEATSKPAGDK